MGVGWRNLLFGGNSRKFAARRTRAAAGCSSDARSHGAKRAATLFVCARGRCGCAGAHVASTIISSMCLGKLCERTKGARERRAAWAAVGNAEQSRGKAGHERRRTSATTRRQSSARDARRSRTPWRAGRSRPCGPTCSSACRGTGRVSLSDSAAAASVWSMPRWVAVRRRRRGIGTAGGGTAFCGLGLGLGSVGRRAFVRAPCCSEGRALRPLRSVDVAQYWPSPRLFASRRLCLMWGGRGVRDGKRQPGASAWGSRLQRRHRQADGTVRGVERGAHITCRAAVVLVVLGQSRVGWAVALVSRGSDGQWPSRPPWR